MRISCIKILIVIAALPRLLIPPQLLPLYLRVPLILHLLLDGLLVLLIILIAVRRRWLWLLQLVRCHVLDVAAVGVAGLDSLQLNDLGARRHALGCAIAIWLTDHVHYCVGISPLS